MSLSDDEYPLPELPRSSPPPPALPLLNIKKRARDYSSSASDAPVFSSDDLSEACLDNYTESRQKRLHRRHWWEWDEVRPRQARRVHATRAIDSGVFLPSDSSTSSSADDGFSVERLNISSAAARRVNSDKPTLLFASKPVNTPSTSAPAAGEEWAQRIVQDCLETGIESIDLSNCNLQHLSNATIAPLANLIKEPRHNYRPASDDAYHALTPSLKLFLWNNSLRSLPGGLVHLPNLAVLTVRNNRIAELPHSLARLVNLIELNVSGNRLRWLPHELLRLVGGAGKLINLHTSHNPLLQPALPPWPRESWSFGRTREQAAARLHLAQEQEAALRTVHPPPDPAQVSCAEWLTKVQATLHSRLAALEQSTPPGDLEARPSVSPLAAWKKEPIYLGSSAVSFFGPDGQPVARSAPAPSSLPADVVTLAPAPAPFRLPPTTSASPPSRVPSLFALAALTLSTSPHLAGIADYFSISPEPITNPSTSHSSLDIVYDNALRPSDHAAPPPPAPSHDPNADTDLPPAVTQALRTALASASEGGRRCGTCGRGHVVARAEWIEWWHCAPEAVRCAAGELGTPFLRRACSWVCVRAVFEERDDGEREKGMRLGEGVDGMDGIEIGVSG